MTVISSNQSGIKTRAERQRALEERAMQGANVHPWDYQGHWLLAPVVPLSREAMRKLDPEQKREQVAMEWGNPVVQLFNAGLVDEVIIDANREATDGGDDWIAWIDQNTLWRQLR